MCHRREARVNFYSWGGGNQQQTHWKHYNRQTSHTGRKLDRKNVVKTGPKTCKKPRLTSPDMETIFNNDWGFFQQHKVPWHKNQKWFWNDWRSTEYILIYLFQNLVLPWLLWSLSTIITDCVNRIHFIQLNRRQTLRNLPLENWSV